MPTNIDISDTGIANFNEKNAILLTLMLLAHSLVVLLECHLALLCLGYLLHYSVVKHILINYHESWFRALSLRKRKLGVAFQAYTQHNSTRGISDAFRIVQTLDKSNTKLASIAQRKIQERNELVPQRETIVSVVDIVVSMSVLTLLIKFKNAYMSPEATQRMKQLKALDAVYYAWCDWQNLRQVSFHHLTVTPTKSSALSVVTY